MNIKMSEREEVEAELKRRGALPDKIPIGQQPSRTPPTGGSGVTKECDHLFMFLRSDSCVRTGLQTDVFFCQRCLEYAKKLSR